MPGEINKDQIVEIAAQARPGYQATWPTLPPGPFVVVEIVGEGEKARATLKDGAGTIFKWFAVGDLRRSAATTVEQPQPVEQERHMANTAEATLITLSKTIQKDQGISLADATKLAGIK